MYLQRICVNALSGLYLISTHNKVASFITKYKGVNALSGLYLISTSRIHCLEHPIVMLCQCPLGLIPHFYREKRGIDVIYDDCVNALSGLYLISTNCIAARRRNITKRVNALSGLYLISTYRRTSKKYNTTMCQCPLGLIPHFYGTPSKTQVLCGFQSLFLQVFIRIF